MPLGRFVPPEVLSPRTFCPYDVLSFWTFCPKNVLSLEVKSQNVMSQDILSMYRTLQMYVYEKTVQPS